MTVARFVQPQPAPTLAAALGTVRARGLRISATRRRILEALFAHPEPASAEEMASRLPDADIGSVYRNLEQLEAIGLVRHVHLGHGPGRYALAARAEVEFAACERCGAFVAVDPRRLDAARELIEHELGYRARFTHFPLVGVCPACT